VLLLRRIFQAAAEIVRYVLSTPVLLESFDNAADFTAGSGATLSNDTETKVQGTGSLAIEADGTQAPSATKTNIATADVDSLGVIAYNQNLGDDPEYQTATYVDMRLGVGGTYVGAVGITRPPISDINLGSYWSSFDISDINGSLPSGTQQIDLTVQHASSAPYCETSKIDGLYANAAGRPTLLITFDNAYKGIIDNVFPKLQALGLKASCFVGGDGVGGDVIGGDYHMTVDDLHTLYNAGWDICPNGTAADGPMTDYSTVAEAIADINGVKDWLTNQGFTRGLDAFCYPNGLARVAGDQVQVAAVTSDGSAVVTMSDTTGITAGRKVAGHLVPRSPATTVVSVDSATQLTLSASIAAGTSAMSFTDTSGPFHTGKLQVALKEAGYKFGRLTANGSRFTRFGLGDQGLLFPVYSLNTLDDADGVATRLDAVQKRGQTVCFFAHNISTNPGDITPDNFNAMADEIASRVAANKLDVLTLSEFLARDGNALPPT
jgi:peptidoglycan/xylan/chitin deacetylase (PgdA/CDA1 family)